MLAELYRTLCINPFLKAVFNLAHKVVGLKQLQLTAWHLTVCAVELRGRAVFVALNRQEVERRRHFKKIKIFLQGPAVFIHTGLLFILRILKRVTSNLCLCVVVLYTHPYTTIYFAKKRTHNYEPTTGGRIFIVRLCKLGEFLRYSQTARYVLRTHCIQWLG